MLLILGMVAGYSAFFVRVYADYQNSARWAREQALADKPADNEEVPPTTNSNADPKASAGTAHSLKNKELGKITGQDWGKISADEKFKLVSTVLNGLKLTGSNIKADEKELVATLDSFYQDENRKSTDIITAVTCIGEKRGFLNQQ